MLAMVDERGGLSNDLFPWIGHARNLYPDAFSDETLETARMWLDECVQTHTNCQRPTISKLPSRVLDVRTTGDRISLWETDGLKGRYATLSHCWGQSSPLTTTLGTMEDRKRHIAFSELPKTFLHAVKVARGLGIPFL